MKTQTKVILTIIGVIITILGAYSTYCRYDNKVDDFINNFVEESEKMNYTTQEKEIIREPTYATPNNTEDIETVNDFIELYEKYRKPCRIGWIITPFVLLFSGLILTILTLADDSGSLYY